MSIAKELASQILTVVAQIPFGYVASYGQIARLAGLPQHARLVGYILKNLDQDSDVAWHRVVNSQGCIRTQNIQQGQNLQRSLLLQEGVLVHNNRVNLKRFAWKI